MPTDDRASQRHRRMRWFAPSSVSVHLAALLLASRLIRGAPAAYLRTTLERLRLIDGFREYDISPKDEPKSVSSEEAVASLQRAGRALSSAQIEDASISTTYSRSALALDLMTAIQYFNLIRNLPNRTFWLFVSTIAVNLRYCLPGAGVGAVRSAEIHEENGETDHVVTIKDFGQALLINAKSIVTSPQEISLRTHNTLVDTIEGLEEVEAESETPLHVEEQLVRLQVILSPITMPFRIQRAFTRYLTGYVVLFSCLVGVALLSPWQELSERKAGLQAFTPSLALLLIATTTLCSIVAYIAIQQLCDQQVATAKTFAKATTIALALGTLILTAGLSAGGNQWPSLAPGLIAYIGILMTSLSADNLVFQAEARLKVLAAESKRISSR